MQIIVQSPPFTLPETGFHFCDPRAKGFICWFRRCNYSPRETPSDHSELPKSALSEFATALAHDAGAVALVEKGVAAVDAAIVELDTRGGGAKGTVKVVSPTPVRPGGTVPLALWKPRVVLAFVRWQHHREDRVPFPRDEC